MKIIDLLNKIANGEEAPKKIMFLGNTYRYDEIDKTYRNIIGNTNIGEMHNLEFYLDDEVEILEEEKKITPTDFENLGYALGSIQKYINKGYNKAIEEKKIPEKLKDILRVDVLIPPVDENMDKIWQQTIKNQNKINSIIDYLKSKGE